jgi:hypothetical protein
MALVVRGLLLLFAIENEPEVVKKGEMREDDDRRREGGGGPRAPSSPRARAVNGDVPPEGIGDRDFLRFMLREQEEVVVVSWCCCDRRDAGMFFRFCMILLSRSERQLLSNKIRSFLKKPHFLVKKRMSSGGNSSGELRREAGTP